MYTYIYIYVISLQDIKYRIGNIVNSIVIDSCTMLAAVDLVRLSLFKG